ncbi:MAG: hypothetical protein AMQ22_01905 [Candidatus Methanofastidiosum methylothiophilum]|uniref:DUF4268 domain-containing protein n=1 Tax=Candidatus Methanofastidiosum methylothiophilum TaxID=1705564 RepID=A0A150ISH9_9EURY|nr:MAG: hypothetical protein AMQ22_01905 [Candidatus Methanofastidiosum methylthiophilus]
MLGTLKKVDLRSIWKNEEYDFSRWLAKTENLQLLSDEIGIQLIPKDTEAAVGRYSVDLLAIEDGTDKIAVIENQLEITDHDHLGKLITYGAGLNATYLIWIVAEIRDEHLNAVEWINENTDGDLNFFLIKLELWQIDDSKPSPKFTTYSKPNDFAKNIKQSNSGEITGAKAKQLEFWMAFQEYINENKIMLKTQKPLPQHWTNISIGTSNAHCAFSLNTQSNEIVCELYIDNNKELFSWLYERKEEIEKELGFNLDWRELPEKKASRIIVKTKGTLENTSDYEKYFQWLIDNGIKFKKVFGKVIKNFG